MIVQLFDDFEVVQSHESWATNDCLRLLERVRHAVPAEVPSWADYPTFARFSKTPLWASRKLEYSFAAEALARRETSAGRPLRVLDVGCGLSPFCNWVALRGHEVTAIDRSTPEIEFLINNDASAFYGAGVKYEVGRAERLAFADGTFDLVTCLSVLADIPPGNDRLALHEMARVLKPEGQLIATFPVAPTALPSRPRRYAEPFTVEDARSLMSFVEQAFGVSAADVLGALHDLTWEQVHQFWRSSQHHDDRADPAPHYLVAGMVLQRQQQYEAPDSNSIEVALLEGHAAYEERLAQPRSGENDGLVLSARMSVLAEQEQAVEAYLRLRRGEGTWQWISPKLGVLRQHAPMPACIPEHYRLAASLPSSPPVISIVTPTLNQGGFLERTLSSVLDQGYPRLEYVVQDGGSSDETLDILRRASGRLSHVDSAKDGGLAEALNAGFQHVTGDILAYLNSDDVLLPGSLHFVAAFFAANPDVDAVYSHRLLIDSNDAEIGRWVLPAHDDDVMPWRDFIPQETLFWRRRLWDQVGANMDESFQFAVDWELLLRFHQAGARFARVPRFLGAFRVHPQQKTSRQLADVGAREMSRLHKRHLGRRVSNTEMDDHVQAYLRRHVVYHKLYRLGVLRY